MSLIPLWVKLVVVGVILAGIATAYNVHVNGLIKVAVDEAVTSNNKTWQEAEKVAIKKSQDEAKVKEAAHAADLKVIAANHAKELANAKARAKIQRDKDVADALSGALSLRIPATPCAGSANVSGAAGGGNPAAGATIELPKAITGGLFSLANDADARVTDLVGKLNTCWQIVASDRKGASP